MSGMKYIYLRYYFQTFWTWWAWSWSRKRGYRMRQEYQWGLGHWLFSNRGTWSASFLSLHLPARDHHHHLEQLSTPHVHVHAKANTASHQTRLSVRGSARHLRGRRCAGHFLTWRPLTSPTFIPSVTRSCSVSTGAASFRSGGSGGRNDREQRGVYDVLGDQHCGGKR